VRSRSCAGPNAGLSARRCARWCAPSAMSTPRPRMRASSSRIGAGLWNASALASTACTARRSVTTTTGVCTRQRTPQEEKGADLEEPRAAYNAPVLREPLVHERAALHDLPHVPEQRVRAARPAQRAQAPAGAQQPERVHGVYNEPREHERRTAEDGRVRV
jgi:hypothetical protein